MLTGRLIHDTKRLAQPTPGEAPVQFVDGVLWMRAGFRVARIEAWPSLRAWSRPSPDAAEREHRPLIDFLAIHRLALGSEALAESSLAAWVCLVTSIPPAIRERVATHRSGHWRLLQLVGHVPPAFDLFDNPALAFLVAHASRFCPRAVIDLPTLVAGRRRWIVGALGFPAVEAMVRLLGRWPHAAIDLSRLLGLREALREDPGWLRSLPHLVRAGTGALDMVSDRRLRPALTRELVQVIVGLADPVAAAACVRLARDTVEMAARPEVRPADGPRASRVRGLGALRRAHDQLAARVVRVERMRESEPLPAPTLAGTGAIQPLTSTGDLFDEGDEQHNCVGSYALRVRSGTFYVYRMHQPERATLSIVRVGGSWLIDDLRTKRNRAASVASWKVARDWLAGTAFPAPPLRGTAAVEPLVSPTMLRAEWHSRALPGSLADDAVAAVRDGHAYFYRSPGRSGPRSGSSGSVSSGSRSGSGRVTHRPSATPPAAPSRSGWRTSVSGRSAATLSSDYRPSIPRKAAHQQPKSPTRLRSSLRVRLQPGPRPPAAALRLSAFTAAIKPSWSRVRPASASRRSSADANRQRARAWAYATEAVRTSSARAPSRASCRYSTTAS